MFALIFFSLSINRFLIYLLGKNIQPLNYKEVIEDYATELSKKQKNGKTDFLENA